jgi:hypothetical protein
MTPTRRGWLYQLVRSHQLFNFVQLCIHRFLGEGFCTLRMGYSPAFAVKVILSKKLPLLVRLLRL